MKIPEGKRAWLLAGAGVTVLGVALAFGLLRPARQEPSNPRLAGWILSAPDAPFRRPSSLPGATQGEGARDLDILLGLYDQAKHVPAAARFAEAFEKQPALKQTWDAFEADQANPFPKQTLASLAESLSEKAEFRQLVSKFAQEPGFRQVMVAASQQPAMKEIISQQLARANAASHPSARQTALRAGSKSPQALARGPRAAFRSDRPTSGAGATLGPGGGAALGNAALAAVDTAKSSSGEKEKNAAALAKVPDAGASAEAGDVWLSICYRNNSGITQQECRSIYEHLGPLGIWGACVQAGLFDKCRDLCMVAELQCGGAPTFEEACRQSNLPEADCQADCVARGECEPDDDPDDDDDPGDSITDNARCLALKPQGKRCFWSKRYDRCWCYTKGAPSAAVSLEDSASACSDRERGELDCVWNPNTKRCACHLGKTWKKWAGNCRSAGSGLDLDCAFAQLWSRCPCVSPKCPEPGRQAKRTGECLAK